MAFKDGSLLAEDAQARHLSSKEWMAGSDSEGSGNSYQAFVESLSASDPRLRNRDPKAVSQKIPWCDSGRVVSLEAGADNSFGAATEFRDPESLGGHLAKNVAKAGRRSVYVLEGLGPGFIGVLGQHFGLHPSVFLDHERVIVMNMKSQGESDGVPLPSLLQGRQHLTLKYFEPLQFDRRPTSFRLVCGDTGRHIGVSRADDSFMDVAVARRKCTVWSRQTDGDGWECLVICDPPITSVRTGDEYRERYSVRTWPYQGGYVDFAPQSAHIRRRHSGRSGPPRSSMLDDLVFYLQEHAADLVAPATAGPDPGPDPDVVVGTFVRKIVASHYFKLAEHLRATLSAAQRALSRKHDLASFPMEKVEELWSDVQAWERRVGEYCEDLEAIMLQLGVPLAHPNTSSPLFSSSSSSSFPLAGRQHYHHLPPPPSLPVSVPGTPALSTTSTAVPMSSCSSSSSSSSSPCLGGGRSSSSWADPTLDFQFLLLRFRELRHRTECLNSAVTGLASITGNRQAYREQQLALETARRSIREAKSSKAVTLLGLIFIPLAYTSSLFSMTEPYGPGGEQFWQYFAVAFPFIAVVMAGYWVLDSGYTDDGTSWSVGVFAAALARRLRRKQGEER